MRSRDSDEDEDKPNEYYTGGEKSGLAVQGPADRVFQGARKYAPSLPTLFSLTRASVEADDWPPCLVSRAGATERPEAPAGRPEPTYFTGAGLELEDSSGCLLIIRGESDPQVLSPSSSSQTLTV